MAANTDKFKKGARRFTTTVGAGGISDATVTTVPLTSVTGLPTDTAIEITVDRVDASGNLTLSKEEVITGVVSGNNLITCTRGTEGTAQAHSAGAVVEVRLTADQWDDVIDGILEEHNQDGTHDTSNMNGYDLLTGWQSYTAVIPTYTSTSNGVDTISFAGVDLTDDYQKGDWVKISSGGGSNLIYKVKLVSFSTNTTMKVVGETSVSGTITAISFSKEANPQGIDFDVWNAKFRGTTTQSIPSSAYTTITSYTEVFDVGSCFSSGIFTAKITGFYSFDNVFGFDNCADNVRIMNNLATSGGSAMTFGLSGAPTHDPHVASVCNVVFLKRGETAYSRIYQDTGGSKSCTGSHFAGHFIGI